MNRHCHCVCCQHSVHTVVLLNNSLCPIAVAGGFFFGSSELRNTKKNSLSFKRKTAILTDAFFQQRSRKQLWVDVSNAVVDTYCISNKIVIMNQ